MNVQQVQGQVFAAAVPAGWQFAEASNDCYVTAPDRSMGVAFSGLEGIMPCTPVQFLKFMADMTGCKKFKLLGTQPVECQGGKAIEAIYTIAGPNGTTHKCWGRVTVLSGWTGCAGYILCACADERAFDQVIGFMQSIAARIQVINGSAAFCRGWRMAVQAQAGANLNHPMDDTVSRGYWDRQHVQDATMARGSDVRRDSYTSSDPVTGQQYYHGQAAWDPTRGGVVNPQRPTEVLDPADHWKKW